MIDATIRYAALVLGLFTIGPLMVLASGSLVSIRGVPGPTVLSSITPIQAIVALSLCLALSLGIAIVVGRLVNAAVGAFVLGAGVAALSMQCGTHLDLLFSGGKSFAVVFETLVWAVVVLVLVAVLFRFSGPLPEQPSKPASDAWRPSSVFSKVALRSGLGGAGMLLAIWLLGVNDLKGQMIAACLVGGIVSGMVGRTLAPNEQPILIFAVPVVFGALGQAYALGGGEDTLGGWLTGDQSPLGLAMPMDLAAGSLMGVSIGLAWSRGRVAEHPQLVADAGR